jgi:hypothetical protein
MIMTHSLTALTSRVRSGLIASMLFAVLALGLLLQPAGAAAQTGFYGPYDDGCYYLWDGVQWTAAHCPQADGSTHVYGPGANGWEYSLNVVTYEGGLTIITYADGTRLDANPDGSLTVFATDGSYGIFAADGTTLIAAGYVDAQGVMVQTTGTSGGGTVYPEVPMDSYTFETWMDIQDSPANTSCLWTANSSTDWDGDYKTGHDELVEYCYG